MTAVVIVCFQILLHLLKQFSELINFYSLWNQKTINVWSEIWQQSLSGKSEVSLCVYKFTKCPFMKYYSFMDMLDKLQKLVCRTVGPLFVL